MKIYGNFIDEVNTSRFQPLKWFFCQYFHNFTMFVILLMFVGLNKHFEGDTLGSVTTFVTIL